jgi:very-short-patch-repair endonuclease
MVTIEGHEVACLPVATCIVESGCLGLAESALVSADAALASGATTQGDLDRALADAAGMRGIRELRRVLSWTDPLRESPGESRLAYSLHRLGYAFTAQVWIGQDRVDALLDDAPVVLEFDGALKYASQSDLVHEKWREDRIRAQGYEFVRRGWSNVGDLPSLDREIRSKVELSRRAA